MPAALFIQVPLLYQRCWKLNPNILNRSIHLELNSAACVLYRPIRVFLFSESSYGRLKFTEYTGILKPHRDHKLVLEMRSGIVR